jgi:ribosomal protein S18 acetylase RimI-like enzyme
MPSGPFDFPRVTDIGPFSEVDSQQEFIRRDNKTFIVGSDVDREVATIHEIDMDNVNVVEAELKVRSFVPDKENANNIRERVKRNIDIVTREEVVAEMDYWYDVDTGVAKIFDVEVDEDFRRMGIATTLKRRELDYMRSEDIDVVYTDIISEGGYRLARKTGFKPITQGTHLRGKQTTLTFNDSTKRGIMFRTL